MDGVGERSERRRERQGTGVHLVTLASRRSRPLSLTPVSSLRSATRYARDRFAPVCDANGMSEERSERVRSGQRRGEHTSLTDSRLNRGIP